MTKYIIIIGGGFSDIGKGVVASSIGYLLKSRGFSVHPLKFDGYLNRNSGTMNPYHKQMEVKFANEEVFVLKDGFEADADSGVYERFLDMSLTGKSNLTGGQVFSNVINKEMLGLFPAGEIIKIKHIQEECRKWVENMGKNYDIVIIEVGGTIGDKENDYFIEAMKKLAIEKRGKVIFILVAPVSTLLKEPDDSELLSSRTKLIRRSIEEMLAKGVQPDIIICRCKNYEDLNKKYKKIISTDCNLPIKDIFVDPDCESIYELPFVFENQGMIRRILKKFRIKPKKARKISRLERYLKLKQNVKNEVKIYIGGRPASYDSYVSLIEALEHAGVKTKLSPKINWIKLEKIKNYKIVESFLKEANGIIITEGLENIEEKIFCIRYAREHNIPFLGISLGFQLAVIEFARNVCGLRKATTEEVSPNNLCVIKINEMKVGAHRTKLLKNSLIRKIYKKEFIQERHRHIGEVNMKYFKILSDCGLIFSGFSEDKFPDVIEIPNHNFFIATQAHLEYTSRPMRPNPVFVEFLKKCQKMKERRIKGIIFDSGDIFYKTDINVNTIFNVLLSMGYKKSLSEIRNKWRNKIMTKSFKNFEAALNEFGTVLKLNKKECKMFTRKVMRKYKKDEEVKLLFSNIPLTLQELKNNNLKLALLANTISSEKDMKRFYKQLGIHKYFDTIVCSCDTKFVKPDKKAYNEVLKRLKLKPNEVLFVGHEKSELDGAKKVGIKTVAINYKKNVKADFYLKDFHDLIKLINPKNFRHDRTFQ